MKWPAQKALLSITENLEQADILCLTSQLQANGIAKALKHSAERNEKQKTGQLCLSLAFTNSFDLCFT